MVCIQDVYCVLNFYENESFSFNYDSTGKASAVRKFPMELLYVPDKDYIVMSNNLYSLECYRYEELALSNLYSKVKDVNEPSSSHRHSDVITEWSYFLGETVIQMQSVQLDRWYIVVLGERNLFVLRENGTLWFVKKFDVNPSCMCSFSNETRDSLVTVVGSHMHNLLIYQNDVLKWATKIMFIPVAIQRVNLTEMAGLIVLMSDEGQLSAGYLGTNPNLKLISMPSTGDSVNFDKTNQELQELKKIINVHNLDGSRGQPQESKLTNSIEIKLRVVEKPKSDLRSNSVGGLLLLEAILQMSSSTPMEGAKLVFHDNDFFVVSPDKHCLNLTERPQEIAVGIQLKCLNPLSNKIKCCLILTKDSGHRTIHKDLVIPFEHLTVPDLANKQHEFVVQVQMSRAFEDKVALQSLFADLQPPPSKQMANQLSFMFQYNWKIHVLIKLLQTSPDQIQIQVESSLISGLVMTLSELMRRLKQRSVCSHIISVGVNFHPIESLCVAMEERLKRRNALKDKKIALSQICEHHRLIQKRILVKLKDKNPTPMNNLDKLLGLMHIKVNLLVKFDVDSGALSFQISDQRQHCSH